MTASRSDRFRQVATIAAAAGQVLLPSLLLPRFAPPEPPNVMQPAPQTFTVWLPIFAAAAVHAGYQAMPGRLEGAAVCEAGWPLTAAYAATAAWAPLVATRRYWPAQVMLFVIAGSAEVARRRIAAQESRGGLSVVERRVLIPPAAMLAAWGAAASTVNLAAMLVGAGPVPPGRAATATGVTLTLTTAATAVAASATADGGVRTGAAKTYLGTVAWALCGIAVGQRERSRPVAAAAAAGLVPVTVALLRGRRRLGL